MNAKALLASLLLLANSAPASTLGIADGTYRGSGRLHSEARWVPSVNFQSVRKFDNGIIEARTKAKLFGITVAEAHARLQFVPVPNSPQKFVVMDLDTGTKAGTASCVDEVCSYSVTVMDGALSLEETLYPGLDGFVVKDGHQVFQGKPAHYEGDFVRQGE